MKLSFLNRNTEIKKIHNAFKDKNSVFIVLYGRRRCGKSTLLQHISKKSDIYFLADQSESPLQREALSHEIERIIPHFSDVHYPSWDALLRNLNNQVKKNSSLILDEFPYLVQRSPELPSALQRFFDLPMEKNFHLIICGSSQRMMQGMVLDATAPLYGRAKEIMRITPLAPGWISKALSLDATEAIKAYAILGGVPRYWELAQDFTNIEDALKYLILDKDGILHDEPMRLLLDDMRSAAQPYSILTLIGNGCHRLSEIAGRLGKPSNNLIRPLAMLMDLGYVRRELPFGESLKSTKRTLYKLSDPFLNFYFTFVLPNKSLLEMGLTEKVYKNLKGDIPKYISGIWEDLSRLSVPYLDINGIQWGPARRWWGSDKKNTPIELDIVAESMDGKYVLLGEAKWAEKINVSRLSAKLESYAARLPFVKGRKIVYAYWLKNVPEEKSPYHVFTASDVLKCLK